MKQISILKSIVIISFCLISKIIIAQSFIWANQLSGVSDESVFQVVKSESGNVYVIGQFKDTMDANPSSNTANLISNGGFDVFVAKYNYEGQFIWAFSFGGNSSDAGTSISIDNDENILIIGHFYNSMDIDPSENTFEITSNGRYDIFVAKYDRDMNFIFGGNIGGTEHDYGTKIITDSEGNIFITGNFKDVVNFDLSDISVYNLTSLGNKDAFFAKYNNIGALQWAYSIGGANQDEGEDIFINNGDIYITGSFSLHADFDPSDEETMLSSEGLKDVFLAKYKTTGNLKWAKNFGGDKDDIGYSIAVDSKDNILLTGTFSVNADFDMESQDGTLISDGKTDVFFAKYNNAGEFLWAKRIGGRGNDKSREIATDGLNVFVCGVFDSIADFNPAIEEEYLLTPIAQDGFVAKYNEDGLLKFASQISGEGDDACNSIFVDDVNNLFLSGHFTGTTDFDATDNIQNLTSADKSDAFVARYHSSYLGLQENNKNIVSEYFPNPVVNKLSIKFEEEYDYIYITLYNQLGVVVASFSFNDTNKAELDMNKFHSGLYFAKINADGINGCVKVLKL